MAKKDGEKLPVAAREAAARKERDEEAAAGVDASFDVTVDGRIARFSGSGFHPARPSVVIHFGDGTRARVSTVDGAFAEAVHEYPSDGSFEAWAEDTRDDERTPLAKRKVSIK